MVAFGAEVFAVGPTAERLARAGLPVDGSPSLRAGGEDLGLLQPRILQGILGAWDQAEARAALEHQGVRRIDMVIAELPAEGAVIDGLRERAAVEALTVLRAAAWRPTQVLCVCDPVDVETVVGALEKRDPVEFETLRRALAGKALAATARLDSIRAGWTALAGGLPKVWSLQIDLLADLPLAAPAGGTLGLYQASRSTGGRPALQLIAGEPLAREQLQAASLAWSAVELCSGPAAALASGTSLVGFAAPRTAQPEAAFLRARALDPRSTFGAVLAMNRAVDEGLFRHISEVFLEAVAAPAFAPEVQALARRQRLRLLQVRDSIGPSLRVDTIRWGILAEWPGGPERAPRVRNATSRVPSPEEAEALELAGGLVRLLPASASVLYDGEGVVGVASGQGSLRDAMRQALGKAAGSARGAVAALSQPVRFADDLRALAEAGVGALRQPDGAPRLEEILGRAEELGLALQLETADDVQELRGGS
jgi:phosphoribosylaminoimidazolecarboxamide formyltransferase/IMP cyclohydrolase